MEGLGDEVPFFIYPYTPEVVRRLAAVRLFLCQGVLAGRFRHCGAALTFEADPGAVRPS